jgi:hypothetical protein
MPGDIVPLSPTDRAFLLELQRQALGYFLENQASDGLFLDRQSNHGPPRKKGWCSTAATGMGLAAVALAAAPPYHLLPPAEAVQRVRQALETALGQLRNDHGIMPHFLDTETGASVGSDALSTIDSTWLSPAECGRPRSCATPDCSTSPTGCTSGSTGTIGRGA